MNPELLFQPLQETDLDLLCHWFAQPHVKQWWNDDLSDSEIKQKYRKRIGNTIIAPFIVYLHSKPIGFIQYYHANQVGNNWWPEETEGTLGLDQFIGEIDFINQGYGTLMIKEFIALLLKKLSIKKIITEVDPVNFRAKRCYEKVGFSYAGEINTPDGIAALMVLYL